MFTPDLADALTNFIKPCSMAKVRDTITLDMMKELGMLGLVEAANFDESIAAHYSLAQLKQWCVETQLSATGSKLKLAQRLITADATLTNRLGAGIRVYVCTQLGREKVAEHRQKIDNQRSALEQGCIRALQVGNFTQALVLAYNAGKRAWMGVSLGSASAHPKPSSREVEIFKHIFTRTPSALKKESPERLNVLRLAAARLELFPRWHSVPLFPEGFKLAVSFEPEWAARLLITHAYFLQTVAELKEKGVSRVSIRNVNDGDVCRGCRNLENKQWSLSSVPELPHAHCTSKLGCRCYLHAVSYR